MEFYIEKHKSNLAYYQRNIDSIKQSIAEYKPNPYNTALWEVGEMLETVDKVSSVYWSGERAINVYVDTMTYEDYESLLDDIDDIMLSNHFTLNVDKTSAQQNEHNYRYDLDGIESNYNTRATICIMGNNCKQVKTGRMIPEIKQDCGIFS